MQPCPRPGCGGSVGVFAWHDETCSLCARGVVDPRPPTAEEKHSRAGVVTETNYLKGIYRIGYVPTAEELSRAVW